MDYTANYQLKKATYSDPASIIDFMGNFDTIDDMMKNINDNMETLKMLMNENTFRNTALGHAITKDLTTFVIQTFTDISEVDASKGDGEAAILNYYKADKHIFDKNDDGSVVIYSIPKVVTSVNNIAWALADWENVAGGSLEVAISRDNGTNFTVLPNNTLMSINSQAVGVNIVVRITMTGKLLLKNIAWGLKA